MIWEDKISSHQVISWIALITPQTRKGLSRDSTNQELSIGEKCKWSSKKNQSNELV